MGVIDRTVKLLAVEAFAVFLVYVVAKNAFGVNILDFTSTRGRLVGLGIALVCLYGFYSALFDPAVLRTIGTDATMDPSDRRRAVALSGIAPAFR